MRPRFESWNTRMCLPRLAEGPSPTPDWGRGTHVRSGTSSGIRSAAEPRSTGTRALSWSDAGASVAARAPCGGGALAGPGALGGVAGLGDGGGLGDEVAAAGAAG
jgi:hypothetical protein